MNRLLPVAARLRSNLLGNRPLASSASEIVELAPPIDREQPAAIALPDEVDRILKVQEGTTLAVEMERVAAGKRPHGPTIAYRVENAVLAEGTLYFNQGYDVVRSYSTAFLLPRRGEHFAEAQLCTDAGIAHYFGHWLRDGLSLELLAKDRFLRPLTTMNASWIHESEYRELCGLQAVPTNHAQIDNLWVIDDRGINANRISRLEELRNRVRSAVVPKRKSRVMLERGALGANRNLVNSHEVQEALERLGFEIVNPEAETPRSIAERLVDADIAILVEGSAYNHCLLAMPTGSTLITIQPPTRFLASSKTFADAIGLRWGFVVADEDGEGFRLPVARLLRTLDEVVRVSALSS